MYQHSVISTLVLSLIIASSGVSGTPSTQFLARRSGDDSYDDTSLPQSELVPNPTGTESDAPYESSEKPYYGDLMPAVTAVMEMPMAIPSEALQLLKPAMMSSEKHGMTDPSQWDCEEVVEFPADHWDCEVTEMEKIDLSLFDCWEETDFTDMDCEEVMGEFECDEDDEPAGSPPAGPAGPSATSASSAPPAESSAVKSDTN
ncbi:hypothetical protein BDEG_25784 [Batrachochytrium dendrobatidis JEL423]|uniref:Uncharacterized protein n=1 Tax=Batrachochytrium dendrobatidis (strain JEL423) TaxID=403673 RepID=A0A177WQC8_BATDL|nr:hypothetical protein BDEG_25784 [Batrachochytrium dendrobatidis JEL423]